MIGDDRGDGGDATEEEGIRVFRVDVKIDETQRKNIKRFPMVARTSDSVSCRPLKNVCLLIAEER